MKNQAYEAVMAELEKMGAKRIRLSMKEEESKPTLELNGVRMIGEGEMLTIAGLPGKGKTGLLEMFAAAVIDGQYGCIKTTTKNRNVLMVETENTPGAMKSSLMRISRRVSDLQNKFDGDGEVMNLEFLSLSTIDTVKGRREAVDMAIAAGRFDFLIIDGVQQFCDGLNDDRSAQQTIDWLQSITIKNNLSTIVTVHLNNDGKSLPGHLGAFLAKRSRAVLFANGSRLGTIGHTQAKLTYGDALKFPSVHYYYCENEKMHLLKYDDASVPKKEKKENVGMKHREVIERIMDQFNVKKTKSKEILEEMLATDKIKTSGEGRDKRYLLMDN